ncbi:hypothetical protein SJDPG12_10320 [Porphyromonas gingivalis SJD12]|nr:hypothetical protein SJDPG12_10320 [Porphyromonas gingivalis SJD12]
MPPCRSPKRIPPNLAQALSQNDSPAEGGFSDCQSTVVLKSKVCKPIMDFREISVILISNLTSPSVNFFQTRHAPKFSDCTLRKTWFEKIFILVREVKNSQTKTKKFRFQFFQKHKPKFREIRFVKYDPANEMKQ